MLVCLLQFEVIFVIIVNVGIVYRVMNSFIMIVQYIIQVNRYVCFVLKGG